jgi:hypothetical protein
MTEDQQVLSWRRANTCGTNSCVEVALTADAVFVRDSDDPSGARLHFPLADWQAFIAGLRIETLSPPHASGY